VFTKRDLITSMFFPKFGSGKVPLFTIQARMVPGTVAFIHPDGA
jgi:hypothetical protein